MSGEAPRTLQNTRGGGVFNHLPMNTVVFMTACIGTFFVQFLFEPNPNDFSIMALPIIWLGQAYRLVSAAFFHGGLMHIGFNMMTLYALGTSLVRVPQTLRETPTRHSLRVQERQYGTMMMFIITIAILLLSNLMYIGSCVLLWAVTGQASWLVYSAVGFSGVLFGFAVQESSLSFVPTRSFYGMCNVPTKYYPWILMIAIQVIMPNISLLGHLCGAVMGFLHVHGQLSWIMPSNDAAKALETWGCLQPIVRRPNFVLGPDSLPKPEGESNACVLLGGCAGFLWAALRPMGVCMWNASIGAMRPAWRAGAAESQAAETPAASAPRYISDQGVATSSPSPTATAASSSGTQPTAAVPSREVGLGPRQDALGDVELAPAARFGLGRGGGVSASGKRVEAAAASEQEQQPLISSDGTSSQEAGDDFDLLQLGSGGGAEGGSQQTHSTAAATLAGASDLAINEAAGMVLGGRTVGAASSGTRRGGGRLAHSRLLTGKK